MLNGISKTLKCVLGLWLGCALASSASAQVVMMGGNSFQAGAVSVGQPRVVGFVPAGHSNLLSTNALTLNSVGQPSATFSGPVMYSNSLSAGAVNRSAVVWNGVSQNAFASPVTVTSGYGRIVRIRYRVPVYGHVKTQSTCGPCGN